MKLTDWPKAFEPLIEQYGDRAHPLEYKNIYQLLVMVILSAQDSDANINKLAPPFFAAYPDLTALSKANPDDLVPYLSKVRSFGKKIEWILEIARQLKSDENIPLTMGGLVALKGVGRKSANVILREAGKEAEGIMVDLHVLRVVPRLGISNAATGEKMEKDLMQVLPRDQWKNIGMAISYLGREVCRPTNPHHDRCVMKDVCAYCHEKQGS